MFNPERVDRIEIVEGPGAGAGPTYWALSAAGREAAVAEAVAETESEVRKLYARSKAVEVAGDWEGGMELMDRACCLDKGKDNAMELELI